MSDNVTKPIEKCVSCGSENLQFILSLGKQYVSDFIDSPSEEKESSPLELVLCNPKNGGCGLLQMNSMTSGERLFRKYWYRSGINESMRAALKDITSKAEKIVKLNANDIVIDTGSNDSTLLRSYQVPSLELIGFEPARNLMKEAQVNKGKIFNNFFNFEQFQENYGERKAKVVTSIAMFYDLPEPNKFVDDVKKCLDEEGIWIIQMNYLVSMLKLNAFDNIGHEHIEYYSLYSLENLLARHNLEVFDVELNDVNGGSYRTYIKHRGTKINSFPDAEKRVNENRKIESKLRLDEIKPYNEFANRIENAKEATCKFVRDEVKKGKKIYLYGASTRGNTLLQYFGLTNELIIAAADRDPNKWGKYTVGSSIPIKSEESARKEKPDYFLVLPWAFIKTFQKREKNFLQSGGKFIVPLPEFKIVDHKTQLDVGI